MQFELETYKRDTPDAELLSDLCRVAHKLSTDTLTSVQYSEWGQFSVMTFHRRFGSWNKAIELAGFRVGKHYAISTEALFENMVEVWTTLGKQPRYRGMHKSKYAAKTYVNRFGTWRKALHAFVDWANEAPSIVEAGIAVKPRTRTSRDINWRLRALVLMRDGARCRLCGAGPNDAKRLEVDHVMPWSKGGETTLENLQILCNTCNVGKSDTEWTMA